MIVAPCKVGDEARAAEPAGDGDAVRRRCLARGEPVDRHQLIRFVVGPEGLIVPDVDERLPGRGLWLTADRAALDLAMRRKLFARAAKQAVLVPDDLQQQLEMLLARRCRELIGLARRAGQAVFGCQKVREQLLAGVNGVLLEATDGAEGECRKLRSLAPGMPVVRVLSAAEIGSAIGREHSVHGVIRGGRLADRFVRDARRLSGIRPPLPTSSQPVQPL